MRARITEGIANNLASIETLDVTLRESTRGIINSVLTTGEEVEDSTSRTRRLVFDGNRCSQVLSTTLTNPRTGQLLVMRSESAFDGEKTIRLRPNANSATIREGFSMPSSPAKDLIYGYTFRSWPLPKTLRFATEMVSVDDAGRELLRVTLPSQHEAARGRTTHLWLDPNAGFLIVKAQQREKDGTQIAERRGTTTALHRGSWFLEQGADERWRIVDGQRQLIELIEWNASIHAVNEPVAVSLNTDLPHGTLVDNKITDTLSIVGQGVILPTSAVTPKSMPIAPRSYRWLALVNILVITVVIVWLAWRSKAQGRSRTE